MAISDKAKEHTELIYKRYGTHSGVLFGIPSNCKSAVETVVQCTLDIVEEEHQDELPEQQEVIGMRSQELASIKLMRKFQKRVGDVLVAHPKVTYTYIDDSISLHGSDQEVQVVKTLIDEAWKEVVAEWKTSTL